MLIYIVQWFKTLMFSRWKNNKNGGKQVNLANSMKKEINSNQVVLHIEENVEPMIAYLYLMVIEYVSNGLFVPSINPPADNKYLPSNIEGKEYELSYFKKVRFSVFGNTVKLVFNTIDEANAFCEEIDKCW